MKIYTPTKLLPIALLLMTFTHGAAAAVDKNYYVVDPSPKSRFDVYNDGKNTYVEAIPGLIVRGATVDGPRYIVNGVPSQFAAQLNGKQITVMRGYPPPVEKAPPVVDAKEVLSRIEQLSLDIKRIESLAGSSEATTGPVDKTAQPPAPEETWVVPHGASLRDVVTQFAGRAGWALDFKFNDVQTGLPSDLELSGGMKLTGTFQKAITEIFSALPASSNITAVLVPDNDPPTLFVYRKGSVK